jgi:hypothetical protein
MSRGNTKQFSDRQWKQVLQRDLKRNEQLAAAQARKMLKMHSQCKTSASEQSNEQAQSQ